MQKNLKAAILAALMLAPTVSFAQDAEESNFSWNAAVVSDYVFRGVTQSNFDVAFQGGLDYAFGDSGFYVGAWGSNIDFIAVDAPSIEVDAYVGYNTDLGEKFNLDVMLTRYTYHGGTSSTYGDIDYNELIVNLAMADVATLTVGYTNNYSNTDEKVTYVNLNNAWDLGNDYSLNAGFGRTFSDVGEYNDWNVGVSKTVKGIEFGLNYYDTNLPVRASDSVVLSIKIGG